MRKTAAVQAKQALRALVVAWCDFSGSETFRFADVERVSAAERSGNDIGDPAGWGSYS
jgi:hypothetical protein